VGAQGQAAFSIHGDALGAEHLDLDPVAAFPGEAEADAALGVHHPVPGQITGQGKAPQGPAHLAGAAIGADEIGNLAVGGQLALRNQGHHGVHALVEGGGHGGRRDGEAGSAGDCVS